MAYESSFYRTWNIIGYTGNLHQAPTVYFEKRTSQGIRYGHITQYHSDQSNIGREEVILSNNYHRVNTDLYTPGESRLFEVDQQNDIRHLSRTNLINVNGLQERLILARALRRFPNLKRRYR